MDEPLKTLADLKGLDREEVYEHLNYLQYHQEIREWLYLNVNREEWGHRSPGYYSPSSLPYCARKMYYQRIGIERRPQLFASTRVTFAMGHKLHDMVQGWLSDCMGTAYEAEVPLVDEELHIRGTADAIITLHAQRRLQEIKSISFKGYATLASPQSAHVLQASCYAYMADCPIVDYVYINKNTGEIKQFPTRFDKVTWRKALDKLERIERCVEKGTPPPYEVTSKCKECDMAWHCEPPEK